MIIYICCFKNSLHSKAVEVFCLIKCFKSMVNTRGDQKVCGKVLLNRIAFIDCNENS